MNFNNINFEHLLYTLFALAIVFIWYYVSLPGSSLSYDQDLDHPTIVSAFKQYFGVYLIPSYFGIALLYFNRDNIIRMLRE